MIIIIMILMIMIMIAIIIQLILSHEEFTRLAETRLARNMFNHISMH